ncbi:MAG TPA: acyltransferase [Conexibacter sp.]|nr:acyltransferase [Conexibacter sp.]
MTGRRRSRPELRLEHAARQGRGLNNFDLLRLVGATLVIVAHSLELTRIRRTPTTVFHEGVGEIGVVVFFAISGFLVARSWAYDPRPLSFAIKRALRLLPALVVSLLLTALVLGPLTTTLPLGTYLQEPGTKAYVLNNATFQLTVTLPGVFAHTPFPNVVNASLWTLPLEVKAYCLVLVLGLLGLFGRRRLLMPVVGVFLALLAVASVRGALPLGDRLVAMMNEIQAPPTVLAQARANAYQELARVLAAFGVGASLFALARWVPLRWTIACALAVAWVILAVASGGSAVPVATALLLPYVVILLAYRTTHLVRMPRRLGDYSYGLYIFAFPVQQAILQWLAPTNGWVTLALTLPLVLALAVASWHFVEAPALTLKQRIWQPLERAGAAAAAHPLGRVSLQPAVPALASAVGDGAVLAQGPRGSDVDTR